MSDLISLLPDSVANQIAAGEVVQRPASAVKELLENTIDAGATVIKLIIKESGKSLIQVIDNGCGMSERDARMCFERHATSKIKTADDLFSIRTLGFRGEALASIASVAQVELRTKRTGDEVGTSLLIEGTEFKGQTPVNCPDGTSVSVKNLFFNVPARRNFLKSNTLELKYIMEEFFRVALVNPHLSFSFYNQDKILFQLPVSNLRQRISNLFGTNYGQRLIPVEQQTDLVNISGFIGKPEFAKKNRGEQYFFTNGRFMKSPYLHHAIETAFRELIPKDSFPSYFIYLEVDPQSIDVNIHPTKTEINFQDFKSIYAILHAAVKQSIGKFNLSPSLDFEAEQGINIPPPPTDRPILQPTITINPDYNPFEKKSQPQTHLHFTPPHKTVTTGWHKLYEPPRDFPFHNVPAEPATNLPENAPEPLMSIPATEIKNCFQYNNAFLVSIVQNGIVIIDQQHAHERILFEKLVEENSQQVHGAQIQLIPQQVRLNPGDVKLLEEWMDHFNHLGFDISWFGKDTIVINAIPATLPNSNMAELVESVLESLKSPGTVKLSGIQALAATLAKKLAVRRGKRLQPEEQTAIVENLFACKVPQISPDGKPILFLLSPEELMKRFKIS
jgi:DNA mismatch repair protein MutL